jgi:peptidoglycan glycosyltransferase
MNQAIRNIWIAAVVLFTIIFGSLTVIQFFQAGDLKANAWNSRRILAEFSKPRGQITADGVILAQSVPTNDDYKYQREYPGGEMYSNLTGFYSLQFGSTQLESALNDELTGTGDSQFYDQVAQLFSGSEPTGNSVELTIDPALQKIAYDSLPDGKKGAAVVTDPKTGAILAMAVKPSYDANLLAVHKGSEASKNLQALDAIEGLSAYTNPATQDLLAPGSVFKIIDTAAALESGKYTKDQQLDNPNQLLLPGTSTYLPNYRLGVCNSQTKASFTWVLANSCNTAFANIALNLGEDAIAKKAKDFGFGSSMTVPTPVTASKFPTDLSKDQLALSSIGQYNVKATPLQINMLAMAIANGGQIMQPQLVKTVRGADLSIKSQFKSKVFQQATTSSVASDIKDMMIETTRTGTAVNTAIPGVDIASKTGTAEVANNLTNSWYTGFAPANDPKVAVTVVVENTETIAGAQAVTSAARNIYQAVLNK